MCVGGVAMYGGGTIYRCIPSSTRQNPDLRKEPRSRHDVCFYTHESGGVGRCPVNLDWCRFNPLTGVEVSLWDELPRVVCLSATDSPPIRDRFHPFRRPNSRFADNSKNSSTSTVPKTEQSHVPACTVYRRPGAIGYRTLGRPFCTKMSGRGTTVFSLPLEKEGHHISPFLRSCSLCTVCCMRRKPCFMDPSTLVLAPLKTA